MLNCIQLDYTKSTGTPRNAVPKEPPRLTVTPRTVSQILGGKRRTRIKRT